jgi:hypothetical protein
MEISLTKTPISPEQLPVGSPGLNSKLQNPSLYQINTRATLLEISDKLGRPATLDDFPDEDLDRLAQRGFNWLWFLGVWQTGPAGRSVSREHLEWQGEFREAFPDLQEKDICGSYFAISDYAVHSDYGGNSALQRLCERIHQRNMRLLLDFVPNHTALDHPWVKARPEFYIHGTEEQLNREPQNYIRLETSQGPMVLAYGRDPNFSGWPDTLQLNYAEPSLQEAMRLELQKVAALCDGVRCDMAMLLLPDIFERTWGSRPEPFWQNTIELIRSHKPEFLFMAEVYWDLEWALQQQGFDYTYDKRLYDRLRDGHAGPVRDHLRATQEFQQKSARFLENHDEPRAAATFAPEIHRPAAILTYLSLGLRFFHDGQLEGRTKKLSVHLCRRPNEPVDPAIHDFYSRLLECLRLNTLRNGQWQLLECAPAWNDNWTWDCFICFAWHITGEPPLVVAVNYAPNQSQCYLRIPFEQFRGHMVHMQDLMSPIAYERACDDLLSQGLYLDMPAWGYQVFELTLLESPQKDAR